MFALNQISRRIIRITSGVGRTTHSSNAILSVVSTNSMSNKDTAPKRFMSSHPPKSPSGGGSPILSNTNDIIGKSSDSPILSHTNDTIGNSLHSPAGPLHDGKSIIQKPGGCDGTTLIKPESSDFFIPQVALFEDDGRRTKRVLVLCTGGTLTMAPDPKTGALAPVEGAVTTYMKEMKELQNESMPEVIVHEYTPFYDSSDLGPSDWAVLANDIKANYWHFDGFVVLMGTDTMAYAATALSFMLENLNKPVVFTGSQIPLR